MLLFLLIYCFAQQHVY